MALPPGLQIGDPGEKLLRSARRAQFGVRESTDCPLDTMVGQAVTYIPLDPEVGSHDPIYNLVPPPGVPAEFGYRVQGTVPVIIVPTVRTGGDYGITASVYNIPTIDEVYGATVTFWGVPGDPSHNDQRCRAPDNNDEGMCIGEPTEPEPEREAPNPFGGLAPQAFLTLPTSCTGPVSTLFNFDSWQDPGNFLSREVVSRDGSGEPVGLGDCDRLDFQPSISVAPDTSAADTPAGLTVDVKVPQAGLVQPEGLSSADIQNTVVTLPAGVVINPGQAAGLAACQSSEDGVGTESEPSCPSPSRVGTVQIATPLLPDKLEGNVYVLQSDPPNLELLIAASADGVKRKALRRALRELSGCLPPRDSSRRRWTVPRSCRSRTSSWLSVVARRPRLRPPCRVVCIRQHRILRRGVRRSRLTRSRPIASRSTPARVVLGVRRRCRSGRR